jgi:hypothetical protein
MRNLNTIKHGILKLWIPKPETVNRRTTDNAMAKLTEQKNKQGSTKQYTEN